MRKTSKLLGTVAAGFVALTMSAGPGHALDQQPTYHHHSHGISQYGENNNSTSQNADSKATAEQKNINKGFSFFSFGSGNGDVRQGNAADTESQAKNENWTDQNLEQKQVVKNNDHKRREHHKGDRCECGQDGQGGWGQDGQDGGRGGDVSQKGSNSNDTSQNASSEATTKQKNVNAPVSVLSFGSNDSSHKDGGCGCDDKGHKGRDGHDNGGVSQGNAAYTSSSASNGNWTDQSLEQKQIVLNDRGPKHDDYGHKRDNCGCENGGQDGHKDNGNGDVSQDGKNSNQTSQDAKSEAKTEQTNVNAPISILSYGSNNGDVHQGNAAYTSSNAKNENGTDQYAQQDQGVKGDRGNGDVSQRGANDNQTDQKADSSATTKQTNVNAPISILSFGSNNGDVHQGNAAATQSSASNSNGTSQGLGQFQGLFG